MECLPSRCALTQQASTASLPHTEPRKDFLIKILVHHFLSVSHVLSPFQLCCLPTPSEAGLSLAHSSEACWLICLYVGSGLFLIKLRRHFHRNPHHNSPHHHPRGLTDISIILQENGKFIQLFMLWNCGLQAVVWFFKILLSKRSNIFANAQLLY